MFKVGQQAWSVQSGFGNVSRIEEGKKDLYPIVFNSNSGDVEYYTLDGKHHYKDLRPTLFLDEPKEWPNPPAPPKPLPALAVDTPVWVKFFGVEVGGWVPRHFSRWANGEMRVFCNGNTSHTNGTTIGGIIDWRLEEPK